MILNPAKFRPFLHRFGHQTFAQQPRIQTYACVAPANQGSIHISYVTRGVMGVHPVSFLPISCPRASATSSPRPRLTTEIYVESDDAIYYHRLGETLLKQTRPLPMN